MTSWGAGGCPDEQKGCGEHDGGLQVVVIPAELMVANRVMIEREDYTMMTPSSERSEGVRSSSCRLR